jgi:hypothetical protein
MKESEQILLSRRLYLCAAAWAIAVIAMTVVEWGAFDWEAVLLPPMFTPIGLLVLYLADPDSHTAGYTAACFGWLYYFVLTIWSLCAKRRSAFILAFTILCISLFLNVAGCEAMKHGSWKLGYSTPPNKSLEPSAVGFYTVLQKKVSHCRLC